MNLSQAIGRLSREDLENFIYLVYLTGHIDQSHDVMKESEDMLIVALSCLFADPFTFGLMGDRNARQLSEEFKDAVLI